MIWLTKSPRRKIQTALTNIWAVDEMRGNCTSSKLNMLRLNYIYFMWRSRIQNSVNSQLVSLSLEAWKNYEENLGFLFEIHFLKLGFRDTSMVSKTVPCVHYKICLCSYHFLRVSSWFWVSNTIFSCLTNTETQAFRTLTCTINWHLAYILKLIKNLVGGNIGTEDVKLIIRHMVQDWVWPIRLPSLIYSISICTSVCMSDCQFSRLQNMEPSNGAPMICHISYEWSSMIVINWALLDNYLWFKVIRGWGV